MESSQRVLIVEDASNWRTTLKTLLESQGFQITMACNVLEASSALRLGPYRAAILDVRLDVFDDENREGIVTVLAEAHRLFPAMKFIVTSSYYSESEVRSLVAKDVELCFLDKNNFQIDVLFEALSLIENEN